MEAGNDSPVPDELAGGASDPLHSPGDPEFMLRSSELLFSTVGGKYGAPVGALL